MKKQIWLLAFIAALLADITGIITGNETIEWISKPLILPFLFLYFYTALNTLQQGFKKWVYLALFFSWCGDVLLMFQRQNELFFLLGLSAFLLAHIFYILFFHFIRIYEGIRSNALYLVIVVIYYGLLIGWLSPYLAQFKIPVRVYGVVITVMLIMAMHLTGLKNRKAGRMILAGAILFVISDSVLAVNQFYQAFSAAGILIMLTYGAAQLFIVKGAIEYLRGTGK